MKESKKSRYAKKGVIGLFIVASVLFAANEAGSILWNFFMSLANAFVAVLLGWCWYPEELKSILEEDDD